MNLTPRQIEEVRDALENYQRYGSGIPGKRLSWTEIVGKIELYTDYAIDPEREASQLKNDAEALRQFAMGKPPSAGGKTRAIADALLSSLIDLLRHPEIALLTDDVVTDVEVDMILAVRLRNYFLYPHQVSKVATEIERLPKAIAGVGHAHIPDVKSYILSNLSPMFGYRCSIENENDVLTHLAVFLSPTNEPVIFFAECFFATPLHWKHGSFEKHEKTLKDRLTGLAVFRSTRSAELYLTDTMTSAPRIVSIAFGGPASSDSAIAFDKAGLDRMAETIDKVVTIVDQSENANIYKKTGNIPKLSDRNCGISFKLIPVNGDYLSHKLDMDLKELMKKCETDADISVGSSRQVQMQTVQTIRDAAWMEELNIELYYRIKDQFNVDIMRYIGLGARFDYVDPDTGFTAIHVLAHRGDRPSLRMAFQNKDRCDFSIRDRKGHLASHHAFVYAWDRPLARLLRKYEAESGVGLPRMVNTQS